MAIADIMMVMMMQTLMELFGNVPYLDHSGQIYDKTPAYDDTRSIYDALQTRLTEDVKPCPPG